MTRAVEPGRDAPARSLGSFTSDFGTLSRRRKKSFVRSRPALPSSIRSTSSPASEGRAGLCLSLMKPPNRTLSARNT